MHLYDQRRESLCEDSVGGPKGGDLGAFDVQLDEVWDKSATVGRIVESELTDILTDRRVLAPNQIHEAWIQREAVRYAFSAWSVTVDRSDGCMSLLGNYKVGWADGAPRRRGTMNVNPPIFWKFQV